MPDSRRLPRSVRRLAALLAVLAALQLGLSAATAPVLADPRPQVVGGTAVPDGKYLFQVALYADTQDDDDDDGDGDIDDFDRQFCGGTLVRPDWVLTAAHCVVATNLTGLYVTVGRTVLSNTAQGVRRNVAAIKVQPNYTSYLTGWDAALLKLSAPVPGVQPVDLVARGDLSLQQPPKLATVTGWGRTSERGPRSDRMLEANVPLVSDAACAAAYPGETIGNLTVCAGTHQVDTCGGDSGGPLFATVAGRRVQFGVTSWGEGCARPGRPGVYTELANPALNDWIRQTTTPPPPPPPPPPGPRPLALARYAAMAVDEVHGQLFFGAGQGSTSVLVTDLRGTTKKAIAGQTGAEGMVLAPGATRLFVALPAAHAISVINTQTLAEIGRFRTTADVCPRELAIANQRLWYGSSCNGQWDGAIGSFRLDGAQPVVAVRGLYETPLLAGNGSGVLAAADRGLSPGTVTVYDAGLTGTLVRRAQRVLDASFNRDLAITPDSSAVLVASGYPYAVQRLSRFNLATVATYRTGPYPNAARVAPNGAVAAGLTSPYDPDVYVYTAGSVRPTVVKDYTTVGGLRVELQDRGLAFGAGGRRLYVVLAGLSGERPHLDVLALPAPPPPPPPPAPPAPTKPTWPTGPASGRRGVPEKPIELPS